MRATLIFLAACALCATQVAGQRSVAGFTGLVGAGVAGSEFGLNAGAGASIAAGAALVRILGEVQLIAEGSGNHAWTFTNLGPACRDGRTGATAAAGQCLSRTRFGASAELGTEVPFRAGALLLGGGLRIGGGTLPFVSAGYGPHADGGDLRLAVRARAGLQLLLVETVVSLPHVR